MLVTSRTLAPALLIGALAIGCGSNDGNNGAKPDAGGGEDSGMSTGDSSQAAESSLRGTAAVGAPIVSATVEYTCDDGTTGTTETDAGGSYSVEVPDSATACAVQVTSDGQPLFSFSASGAGIANITPLTDMLMRVAVAALASSPELASWFDAPEQWDAVATAIAAAIADLAAALEDAGFSVPADFDPLGAAFDAAPGDPYDDLLEAIAAAIAADPEFDGYEDFAAQFVAGAPLPTPPASAALPNPDGDFSVLGELDGASATVGGTAVTYAAEAARGTASWGKIGVDPNYTFVAYEPTDDANGFNPLTAWRLFGVPGEVGIHPCTEPGDGQTLVRLDTNGANAIAEACKIEIVEFGPTHVKGRFSAIIDGETITDGVFQVLPATGGGGTLAPGEEALVFTVDGTEYKYTTVSDGAFETYETVYASPAEDSSPGFPLGVQLHTIPGMPGTYECGQAYDGNDYRKVNVWFYWNGAWHYAGRRQNPDPDFAGSSCTISLTAVGDIVEGTFSGTFVTDDETASVEVSRGEFRLIK